MDAITIVITAVTQIEQVLQASSIIHATTQS